MHGGSQAHPPIPMCALRARLATPRLAFVACASRAGFGSLAECLHVRGPSGTACSPRWLPMRWGTAPLLLSLLLFLLPATAVTLSLGASLMVALPALYHLVIASFSSLSPCCAWHSCTTRDAAYGNALCKVVPAVSTLVTNPCTTLLVFALPLAVTRARLRGCIHVPAAYCIDAAALLQSYPRALEGVGRPLTVVRLPRAPLGSWYMCLFAFATPGFARRFCVDPAFACRWRV